MEDRESFILIKPDGLKNKKVLDSLVNLLSGNSIEIVEKKIVVLNYDDILIMWPAHSKCFITRELLANYLADKNLEIWRVVGENISNKLNKIKEYIRENFGRGSMENCIHTPYDGKEAKWQYSYINKEKIEMSAVKANVEYHTGLFGKILNVDQKVLKKILDDVMRERERGVNAKVAINQTHDVLDSRGIVILLDQTKVSMDYVVSVLFENLGDCYSLKEIIHIVLDVDLYGEKWLVITSRRHANMLRNNLVKKYKLDAEVGKIVLE